ncbi:MAG: CaiB/BaiF CoA transferase family protein [Bacillota bacterium]
MLEIPSSVPSYPLQGIRVLDFTRVLAGPYCTMILADLGAEVIKVEHPEGGDDARAFGPFQGGKSAYFMSVNRGKKSITVNLKSVEGRELISQLAQKVDVVVENFRPGTMDRLGLGAKSLRAINPALIYAACSGFGQTGPWAGKPAYDMIVQGAGGMMSITGQPGGQPTRVGASIGDLTAGLFTAIGIVTALYSRRLTGQGQVVDVSMLDGQVALLENAIARYAVTGEIPGPLGGRHPSITPFENFATADGWIIVAAGNDQLWGRLCRALGREDLINLPQFATNKARTDHYQELRPHLVEAFSQRSTGEWLTILEEAGVPCGPINNIAQVVSHPQVRARNMIVEVEDPVTGRLPMAGNPIKLSNMPDPEVRPAAPALGQHTKEVLAELLVLPDQRLEDLRRQGVI